MIEALGFLIVAAVALYIAWPLGSRSSRLSSVRNSDASADLRSRRETLYREIADLELDHGVGKVSEQDYRLERDGYVAEAAAVLEQLDREGGTAAPASGAMTRLDRELEEEIRQLRHQRRS